MLQKNSSRYHFVAVAALALMPAFVAVRAQDAGAQGASSEKIAPSAPTENTDKPQADSGSTAVLRQGEVSANDVYVRSGDSMNHYTICKLNAGDKLAIVGERGDWYEIRPPAGTFSLVSGDYVDTVDGQTGTINGNNVRVRAGSTLNDNKYTVQTLLTKGTPVEIVGKNADGFYRIKPPEGATLWVSKSLVNVGGVSSAKKAVPTAKDESTLPTAPSKNALASQEPSRTTPSQKGAGTSTTSTSAFTGEWRSKLDELDALARAESQKPTRERDFGPIIGRFQPIAEQNEDEFAKQFAQRRIDQMNNMMSLTDAIKKVRELDDMSESRRREFLAARAAIPEPTMPIPSGIEIRGELRPSAAYPPDSVTPRYRLIDPQIGAGKTAGYVEIPPNLHIRIDEYLGRPVIVRASEMRPHKGGVEPIPIYIAREIVLADEMP